MNYKSAKFSTQKKILCRATTVEKWSDRPAASHNATTTAYHPEICKQNINNTYKKQIISENVKRKMFVRMRINSTPYTSCLLCSHQLCRQTSQTLTVTLPALGYVCTDAGVYAYISVARIGIMEICGRCGISTDRLLVSKGIVFYTLDLLIPCLIRQQFTIS